MKDTEETFIMCPDCQRVVKADSKHPHKKDMLVIGTHYNQQSVSGHVCRRARPCTGSGKIGKLVSVQNQTYTPGLVAALA